MLLLFLLLFALVSFLKTPIELSTCDNRRKREFICPLMIFYLSVETLPRELYRITFNVNIFFPYRNYVALNEQPHE